MLFPLMLIRHSFALPEEADTRIASLAIKHEDFMLLASEHNIKIKGQTEIRNRGYSDFMRLKSL